MYIYIYVKYLYDPLWYPAIKITYILFPNKKVDILGVPNMYYMSESFKLSILRTLVGWFCHSRLKDCSSMWRCLQDQLAKGATCRAKRPKKNTSGTRCHQYQFLNMMMASNISNKNILNMSLLYNVHPFCHCLLAPLLARTCQSIHHQWNMPSRGALSGALGEQSARNAGGTRNLRTWPKVLVAKWLPFAYAEVVEGKWYGCSDTLINPSCCCCCCCCCCCGFFNKKQ